MLSARPAAEGRAGQGPPPALAPPREAAGLPQSLRWRWEAAAAGTRLEGEKRGARRGSRLPPRAAGGAQKRRRRNEAVAGRARLCRAAMRGPSASLQTPLPRSAAHLLPGRSGPLKRTEDGAPLLLDVFGEEGASGEGREGMTIRIKRKGGKKSNTHAKKSLFSREKSKIATKALKVARLVICIIRCRCCLAPPAVCLRNMQGGRGGAIYFFCDLSFFKKKAKPNQSHPAHSTPLMERWLQVVVSEPQVEFSGEKGMCTGPMRVLLWRFVPSSLATRGEGAAGADARPEGCQGVLGGN